MSSNNRIVITAASRTPIGKFLGQYKAITAPELGAAAITAAIQQNDCQPEYIEQIFMGCVLTAGLRQAPARQAGIYAELPHSTQATTINKVCGSGMQAIILAHDSIKAQTNNCIVAGGMENMTLAPYLSATRQGHKANHTTLYDHMFIDGLENAYPPYDAMGMFAEQCANEYNISRKQQDDFAVQSLQRAHHAWDHGFFDQEIASCHNYTKDEIHPLDSQKKIATLKPAFKQDGTITAANASSISDGAAAIILMNEATAKQQHIEPIASIVAHSSAALQPSHFTIAPIHAIKKLLQNCQWSIDDVDLFEINEAFAVVTLAAMKELNIPHEKINIHGGACALGHPIGASGARILVTLIHALKQHNKKRGIAALCIGGGEATAIAIECLS